jgi:hypothetical protein
MTNIVYILNKEMRNCLVLYGRVPGEKPLLGFWQPYSSHSIEAFVPGLKEMILLATDPSFYMQDDVPR